MRVILNSDKPDPPEGPGSWEVEALIRVDRG